MSNRILDYPEATGITSDDYILLDNEGTGAKCIKASALNINMDNYTIKEASGAIASFDDGEDLPLAFMGAYITAIQEGSGDPSPTNVRPISGWDECNVGVSGVNLFDVSKATANSAINASGQVISGSYYVSDFISVKPSTSVYILNVEALAHTRSLVFYGVNKELISVENVSGSNVANSFVKEIPNNVYYIRIGINPDYINNSGVNYPSTDTEYHAYNGNTYSLTFTDGSNPLTVYGGTVDLVSGQLVVNRAEIDLGSRTYNKSADGYFYAYITDISILNFNANEPTAECEIYKLCTSQEWYNRTTDSGIFGVESSHVIYVADTRFSDGDSLKTALTGKKLVYTLAVPLTYSLTKQQIKSLVGENNIFADTGDSVVDYRKLWVMPEM